MPPALNLVQLNREDGAVPHAQHREDAVEQVLHGVVEVNVFDAAVLVEEVAVDVHHCLNGAAFIRGRTLHGRSHERIGHVAVLPRLRGQEDLARRGALVEAVGANRLSRESQCQVKH